MAGFVKPMPKALLMVGILLALGAPCLGFIFTVIGMIGAFHALGDNGISNPSLLASDIGKVLVATWDGFMIGMLGWPLVLTGAVLHYRSKPTTPPANPHSQS